MSTSAATNSSLSYAGESYAEKAERKFKENPAVPIGALATTAALTMAMFKMRAGDPKSFNNWLRMRVLFQGLTIAAVCAGTYSFGLRRQPELEREKAEEDDKKRREERVGRERAEFEERLKAAEEFHDAEVGFQAAAKKAKETRANLVTKVGEKAESLTSNTPNSSSSLPPAPAATNKSSGGWRSWFGF